MRLYEIDDKHFYDESEITDYILYQIYDGIVFMASKYRTTNFGAALFHALNKDDKIEYFNKCILPIYTQHNLPIPGKEPYLEFQNTIRDIWREIKKEPDLNYYDETIIKKVLGL